MVSLRAPLSNDFGPGYKWFRGFSPCPEPEALTEDIPNAIQRLRLFFEQAPLHFGTAANQQYVLGFSQGATIGWSLALTGMNRNKHYNFPRFILISGRLMPDHDDPALPLGALTAEQIKWDLLEHSQRGSAAMNITPIRIAQLMKQLVAKNKIESKYGKTNKLYKVIK